VNVAQDLAAAGRDDASRAAIHFRLGAALESEGTHEKKDQLFSESCDELKAALSLDPSFAIAHYVWGESLSHLHQDDAARAEFKAFLAESAAILLSANAQPVMRTAPSWRAPRMAPPFAVTTIDGRHISMDSLAGKVVLIDFWATWCGPCREALPHVRDIARKFQGQPFVVLSVSLDDDDAKWKDFVNKNE